MASLILRRLAVSVPLLLVVSFLTFALVSLTPGDAAYTILGARATPAQLAALRGQLGLNHPLLVQYVTWLGRAMRGDLGTSLVTGQPVLQAIGQRLPPTLFLVCFSTAVIAVAGVLLGVFSAVRGGWLARTVDLLGFAGLALPNFVLSLYLIPLFALRLGWFPSSGYTPIAQSPGDWLRSLVLPVAALSFGGIGVVAKQTRAGMEDVLSQEFVMVMRANGFRRRSIIYRHALKAAAVPIIAVTGVVFVGLLSGTVLVEAVFAGPGLGGLAVQGSSQSDLTIVQGVTVVFTLIVVAVNLLLDICYAAVNPKVALA